MRQLYNLIPVEPGYFFDIMRIAIQGDRGSFHEEAAVQYFNNEDIEFVPFLTFDSTINSVRISNSDLGIVAIENSRSGSILYNYTLIRESGLKVIGEHSMYIRQNLMALAGQSICSLKEIWSHPVAISQCMGFLKKYPDIALVETDDTARSAKRISEGRLEGVAAIGSTSASELYKLPILAGGIQTYKENYTKFLIVSRKEASVNGANKASLCFSLGHKPGSLAFLLTRLGELGVNLSKIQSVPKPEKAWEYLFYVDIEFDNTIIINSFLELLRSNTNDLELLGIYKKGNSK